MRSLLFTMGILLFAATVFAQDKEKTVKKLPAVRTTQKIVIDGDLKDSAWLSAPVASGLVEWRPSFGRKEADNAGTEIRILYDNSAIYVSGYCHMPKDSISSELVGRDKVGANDYVGILFDTYNDKINGFGYYVTPLGEQYDAKYSARGEDDSWNSVYETQSKIVADGWTFEMRIPYSAIRFSTKNIQDWGLNITRRNRKTDRQYMWSPTDPTIGGNFFAQFGLWTGVENIKPPVRLSFSPYLSAYANHYPYNDPAKKNFGTTVNGGMDLKYGISQSFTLDMTLIPDFGQVQSDNQVLNLTPFEVKYNENRSFFTEGTELFSKGNLFYSRRIGGEPLHYGDVASQLLPGETLIRNPSETRLLNATKVSGRTSSGLGIGIFNAVTKAQYATAESANGKDTRQIETDPLTNYNIVVFDQSLKRNSSVSLINTNVTRNGTDYDANVTAFLWDLYDKKNNWNLFGKLGESQLIGYLPGGKTQSGYTHQIGLGKTGGRLNMNFQQELADDKYSSNDMGYFTNNNFVDHYLWVGYKWIKPKAWYNRLNLNFNGYYSRRFKPWDYQMARVNVNFNGQLKTQDFFGIFVTSKPAANDFYEPRVAGKVFKRPGSVTYGGWFEKNYARKIYYGGELDLTRSEQYNSNGYELFTFSNYRFNKKFSLGLNANVSIFTNNLGFAATSPAADSVYFALRKRNTVETIFNVKYNFTNKMGLTFRARHYWSAVNNRQFFSLQQDGALTRVAAINQNVDYNVNYFNIDMVYTWQFALGSFLNIVWKNSINTFDQNLAEGYFKNAGNTLQSPQLNSLSIRVIYFLDYLSLKKVR
ncbi:MAG: carbohydrate binding family 9 domain-containing protein [Chitinophagaceae bacterium]|nr:carbohydrate binding family 9 domain-containing protein [Chitinophagaceae bacterium]